MFLLIGFTRGLFFEGESLWLLILLSSAFRSRSRILAD